MPSLTQEKSNYILLFGIVLPDFFLWYTWKHAVGSVLQLAFPSHCTASGYLRLQNNNGCEIVSTWVN